MLVSDLRRYIEDELHERVRTAELAYRSTATGTRFEKTEMNRSATEIFREALHTFNDFLLYNRLPPAQSLLEAHLRRVVEETGAYAGNIQVFDGKEEVLKIKVNCGFKRPFLDFFATVRDECGTSCGAALKTARRVVVRDVTRSKALAGTAALEALREAGVMACQSTPLVSPTGELVGMLSTHYREPKQPSQHDIKVIDQLAMAAAAFLVKA